ncbi:(2Fe-2S)-binding protein [Acidovorax sp. FJL06]|uniref:(2Fe-2S)-binding protein n=1 Tax=Acidovorax sp. FJL06 TaxID=2153365 RepID=UPI000F58F0DB|nr:(2Fe-2S)-binding protein [Acidovorax sp. FJL06]RQO82241.1 ferredoxin [Acidovorax sp. FJL06]
MSPSQPLLHRVAEKDRAPVRFTIDGQPAMALEGDTVLTAILTQRAQLRRNEFSHEPRAGFCWMGACQDCWVLTDSGERLRACSTFITPGLALRTEPVDAMDFASGGQA